MSIAYIDTSALVAIEFNELDSVFLESKLREYETVISSNLLEAEYRSACARRNRIISRTLLRKVDWVLPQRSLTTELETVLNVGYLRGADLYHVATALNFAVTPSDLSFVTVDIRQGEVAAAVGFVVWPELPSGPSEFH